MSTPRSVKVLPDERQREAIEHVHGPMLVIAGAGTGKTTVLTRRIARLIQTGQARPDEVLAVTYTDNAAAEMRERVKAELPGIDLAGLQATTFHAFCNELLRANQRNFGVLDDKDLWIYLRRRIRDLRLNYFVRAANLTQFLDELLDFIRRCHDELVGPERYSEYVRHLEAGELPIPRVTPSKDTGALSPDEVIERCREIARVFNTVEKMLRDENLGTFSHMITRAHDLLQQSPQVLAQTRQRTRFILVDEFQDANFAQVRILSLLSTGEHNVFAVGDPDQAIYRFRGASSAAFDLFDRHFPGARLVVLEKNQRSTSPILLSSFAVIDRNPAAFSVSGFGRGAAAQDSKRIYRRSPLLSARDERAALEGKPLPVTKVEVVPHPKDGDAGDVVATIEERRRQLRARWSDFAVLYRSHIHRDDVARELGEKGIPFIIENLDVMDTPEVRDLLACLGAVHSAQDATDMVRVAALPQFDIAAVAFRAAIRASASDRESAGGNLEPLLHSIAGGSKLIETLRQARLDLIEKGAKASVALASIARRFGLDSDAPTIRALLAFAAAWEKKPLTKTGEVGEFLDYLTQFREARGTIALQGQEQDSVRLMTAHSAKGLEFKHVFVIRATAGSFPCGYREVLVEFPQDLRDPDSVGEGDAKCLHDQEERRLFYVAMTRARDSLTLYGKQGTGKSDKTPPGILRELLKDPNLRKWLKQRPARALQVNLFASEAPRPTFASRTAEWVSLPPGSPLNRLSATAIERYEICPLQFKLEREWRLPTDVPAAMQYGASMHRVLRTYFDSMKLGRPLTEAALIDLFRSDLAQSAIEDRYQHELYEKQGIRQLRDLLASGIAPTVLHTEEPFEMHIGEAVVVGRIDRIDDLGSSCVAIVDYKTGKPRSQEDADESLQLSIYALAAQSKWGYQPRDLVFYNLEDNMAVTSRRGNGDLEAAKGRVLDVMDQIASGKFDAKPGFHCRSCAYRNLCPATEKHLLAVASKES